MSRMFDPEIWRDVTGGDVGERVRKLTRVTPLVPAPALGRRTGADVWLKLENLQRTGSFKLRGATHKISRLDAPAGVVAGSAGNHGQSLAYAARAQGIPCEVFMPREAVSLHVRETGVEIALETRGPEHSDAIVAALQSDGYAVRRLDP